jgi:hypothetical protein
VIPYTHADEKSTLLYYANLLNDKTAKAIIERDSIDNKDEAIHFASFFWEMARQSNEEDVKLNKSSEYILEKIINTLMAYYRKIGYEDQWEEVADKQ